MILVNQPLVIDPQTPQDRGIQVVNVHGILGDVVAVVIRFAEGDPRLDAAPRQPDRKRPRMMIAAVVLYYYSLSSIKYDKRYDQNFSK